MKNKYYDMYIKYITCKSLSIVGIFIVCTFIICIGKMNTFFMRWIR